MTYKASKKHFHTLTAPLNMNLLAILVTFWASGVQPKQNKIALLQTVQLRDDVTIKCYLTSKQENTIVWYKQSIGQLPQPVALSYLKNIEYMDEFNNGRFTVSPSKGSFHLNITATTKEDTGIYYCGTGFLNKLEFISGTYLMLKGFETQDLFVEQHPMLLPVHQGDSVKIQCEILTKSCAEDHTVYWFRHGSSESHPGILYTHSSRHDQCNRSPRAGSKTHRCVYNFSKTNLSHSDAGTYYCAIAACGEILFGNGTTLKMTDNKNQNIWDPLLLCLITSNVVFLIIIVIFFVNLCKNWRKRHRGSTKLAAQSYETGGSEVLNYAAVSFVPDSSSPRRSRRSTKRHLAEYTEVNYKLRDHMP